MIRSFLLLLLLAAPAAAETELDCLAKVLHNEARGEPLRGQLLVAETVFNRITTPGWPKTLCGVVNQPGQFAKTPVLKRSESYAVAELILQGELVLPSTGALYFHSGKKPSGWKNKVAEEGNHSFYKG